MSDHRTLFDGPVYVSYSQMYVMSAEDFPDDPYSGLDGQHNGMCGAGLPGFLCLVTSTHTGEVPVRVEAWEREPVTDAVWEDVVGRPS